MKKLITVISILFLTAVLTAREFAIPSFNYTFDEVLNTLREQNYSVTYDKKEDVYVIEDMYFKYNGIDIEKVTLHQSPDTKADYFFTIYFNGIDTNLYMKCVFKLMKASGVSMSDIDTDGDLALIIKKFKSFFVVMGFYEYKENNDDYKIIQFIKIPN